MQKMKTEKTHKRSNRRPCRSRQKHDSQKACKGPRMHLCRYRRAFYRTIALSVLRSGIDPNDTAAVVSGLKTTKK